MATQGIGHKTGRLHFLDKLGQHCSSLSSARLRRSHGLLDHHEAARQQAVARVLGEVDVQGLVRSVLLRPNREGDPYLATMEFETEDDFTAWRNSDAFRAAHGHGPSSGGDAGGATAPPVESYSVVNQVPNASQL